MSKLVRNTIPFKVTRTSQPQFATGIDWSNPITRGLVLCVDSATGYRDLFSPSGVNSGVSSRATQKGISGYFGGAQRYSLGRKAFTNLYYGSVVFDIRIDVFDSAHVFYEAGTGFNNIAVKIPANTSSALKFNVGSNTDRSSAKTSWTSGQWYNIAIVWDAFAPTVKLYINGVIDSTFAVTSFTNASSFNTSIGSYDIGTFGSYFTGSMSGITGFKRALTDPEIKSLSENPWQIFQPIVRQIPYDMLRGAWQRRESYLLGTTPPTLSASMPAMVGKRVWTSQPQVPVQLDWSNPITRGLFVCIEPSQTFLNGRQNGVLSTGSTLPPLSATKNGLGRKTTGGTYDLRIQADGPTLSTDSWTIAVRLVPSANASLSHLFGYGLAYNSAKLSSANNGKYRSLLNYNNNYYFWGGSADWDTGIAFNTDGVSHTAVVTSDGTTLRFYLDGTLRASSAKPALTTTLAGSYAVLGNQHDAGANSPSATLLNGSGWGRTLSDSEIKSLSENPWQIFAPLPKQVWVAA